MRNIDNRFSPHGLWAVFLLVVALAGCSVKRPVDQAAKSCDLPFEEIEVDVTPASPQAAITVSTLNRTEGFFEKALRDAIQTRRENRTIVPATINVLVLSGGGQHGSFGSGFLKGLQTASTLPRYDLVTGVSTGALQATFAFLGQDQAPDDRVLGSVDDFPVDANVRPRTNIDDLVSGYTISREETLYKEKGVKGILRKAAKGSLSPLARRLDILITPKTLAAVKYAHDKERRTLLVALLNYESGKVEIIDMTALAARYDGSNFELIRHCYNQVLIAASSEPIGAPPVVIDGKLYFDAGLRYGVFLRRYSNDVQQVISSDLTMPLRKSLLPALRTDIIVNGDLDLAAENEKFSKKFNALTIAGQGRKILVDQIYRFSVAEITGSKSPRHAIRLAAIRTEESRSKKPKPKTTFDPIYMKAMIKLGKKRGAAGDWQSGQEVAALQ